MASSAVCQVRAPSLGVSWVSTTNGTVTLASSETVEVRLASSAGVGTWALDVYGTDDLVAAPTITQATSSHGTATFSSPGGLEGWSLILRSRVGANSLGYDANGVAQRAYTSTFKIARPTTTGHELIASNEVREGNPEIGTAAFIDAAIRTMASGSFAGDAIAIRGVPVSTATPSTGQGLIMGATGWAPATVIGQQRYLASAVFVATTSTASVSPADPNGRWIPISSAPSGIDYNDRVLLVNPTDGTHNGVWRVDEIEGDLFVFRATDDPGTATGYRIAVDDGSLWEKVSATGWVNLRGALGPTGPDDSTVTTAAYTQPSATVNVTIFVAAAAPPFQVGDEVFIAGGGRYVVQVVDVNSIVVSYPYTNYAMASSGATVPVNACVVPLRRMAASYLPAPPPGGASGDGILAIADGGQSVGYQFSTGPARIVHSVNGTVFSVDNNGVVTLRYGSTIREYAGTPESHVYARIGSICLDITNGAVYRKTTIETSNTGWVAM